MVRKAVNTEETSGMGVRSLIFMQPHTLERTALSRQIEELVRIARIGGAGTTLNSESDFDRCHIQRLIMGEMNEEESKELEEQEWHTA